MSSTSSAFAKQYVRDLTGILTKLPFEELGMAMDLIESVLEQKRQLFLAGNGGSAATASHMANDLLKTMTPRFGAGIRALSLTDNVQMITATANDADYREIFAAQLDVLAHEGDVLIVISGSGSSPNILRAIEVAKKRKLTTIGFLGKDGGKAKTMVDIAVVVPSGEYGPIEDAHLVFNHLITAYLRERHGR